MQSLTEQYDGWIKKITRRMYNKFKKFYPYDDLLSTAYLASVEAERTYNPEKAKFSAYVKPRIEGAIIRSVSNTTNSQDKMLQAIYKFIDDYYEKHGKIPARHIILKEVGVTEKQFIVLLDLTNKVIEVDFDTLPEYEAEELDLDSRVEYDKIMDVVASLPKQQRERINDFLYDPMVDSSQISDIINDIQSKLNIGE